MKKFFTIAAAMLTAMAANAEVLWQGSIATGSWGSQEGVSCLKIGKASFATADAGDKLSVTLSEVGADAKLLYKDGASWAELPDAPAVEPTAAGTFNLTLEKTTVEAMATNGLILQGNNITITKVELSSASKFDFKEVWTGTKEITWDGSTAPRVTDVACADLKAGDVIAVTLSAIGAKDQWPKCCFRAVKDDQDIATLELWDFADETMPVTKNLVIDDPEKWAYGFYIVGGPCTVTKIELGFKAAGGQTDENILWEGDPTAMSWGAGPTVSATKAAQIKAGDIIAITVSSIADTATEEWPKVICRCEDGWAEIFTLELWDDRTAGTAMPTVKKVKVTEEMLEAIHKGFNFGGSGASIEKVALLSGSTPSGVTEMEISNADTTVCVYSISGVCVRAGVQAAEALLDLPAGIYIVNGKKYMVK